MPLQLADASTERPKQIQWDPTLSEDWEAADRKIRDLRNQGFTLRAVAGDLKKAGIAFMDPPARDPNLILFRVLSDEGDTRLVWDRREPDQVKEAYARFKELLDKGYTAYCVRSDGKKGSKLEEFDPLHEEIVMVPKTMPG
ncbi:MAG: hypothetical protein GWO44_10910 [Thermoplasmata archaeon]|nr:hypothetical protein [Thermoplasmata archaeon]NIY03743.1 hypothetical protein [Thermoplasmata archaeon]